MSKLDDWINGIRQSGLNVGMLECWNFGMLECWENKKEYAFIVSQFVCIN